MINKGAGARRARSARTGRIIAADGPVPDCPHPAGAPRVTTRTASAASPAVKRPPRPGPHRDPRVLAAVAVGGIVGALARAAFEDWFPVGSGFPWTTLLINLAGTAILAWVVVRVGERLPPSTYVRPLLGTGFCGALTTFSTMQIEAVRLSRHGHVAVAIAYPVASLLAGVLVTAYVLRAARHARWSA